jgi:hypothetical protein
VCSLTCESLNLQTYLEAPHEVANVWRSAPAAAVYACSGSYKEYCATWTIVGQTIKEGHLLSCVMRRRSRNSGMWWSGCAPSMTWCQRGSLGALLTYIYIVSGVVAQPTKRQLRVFVLLEHLQSFNPPKEHTIEIFQRQHKCAAHSIPQTAPNG